jgi:hypothetical protein
MEDINEKKEIEKEKTKKKNFWKIFNPSLKDIENRHPNISILGLWWSWYWRLAVLVISVWLIFTFAAFIFFLFYHS